MTQRTNFDLDSARRIANATRIVEGSRMRSGMGGGDAPVDTARVFKITAHSGSGVYTADEQYWDGSAWADKTVSGRNPGSGDVPSIREFDLNEDVPVDSIVVGWYFPESTSGTWAFAYRYVPTGTDDDIDKDLCSAVDVSTVDQIEFSAINRVLNCTDGIVTTNTAAAADPLALLSLDALWLYQTEGTIYHGVTDYSGSEAWFNVDVALNGGGNMVLYFDNCGHLHRKDSTDAPGGTQKYKYVDCDDPSEIHYATASLGTNTVFEVSGTCWENLGQVVTASAEEWAPTISANYTSCSACDTGSTNYYIKKCSDDSLAFVLGAQPTDDYFYGCISSAYVEVYWDGTKTAVASTSPTLLYLPCGSAPTSCADLSTTVPVSDNFGGSVCNSGTVGDDNYDFRWPAGGGTPTITGGVLQCQSGSGDVYVSNDGYVSHSGDFTITCDWTMSGIYTPASAGYGVQVLAHMASGGTFDVIYAYDTPAAEQDGEYRGRTNSNQTEVQVNNQTSGKIRLRRVSGTIYADYWNGTGWTNIRSDSNSADLDGVRIGMFNDDGANTITVTLDNLVVVDGSSNDIYVDWAGTSC